MSEEKDKASGGAEFRFMRLPEVCRTVGVGKSTIWDNVRRGAFPCPVKVSENCTAWRSDEVEAWMASRPRVDVRKEVA